VLLQLRRLLEGRAAAAAGVRPLPGVAEHVRLQVSFAGAALAAPLAGDGLLPRVGQPVLPQRVPQVEALVAASAGVAPLSRPVAVLAAPVQPQAALAPERLLL